MIGYKFFIPARVLETKGDDTQYLISTIPPENIFKYRQGVASVKREGEIEDTSIIAFQSDIAAVCNNEKMLKSILNKTSLPHEQIWLSELYECECVVSEKDFVVYWSNYEHFIVKEHELPVYSMLCSEMTIIKKVDVPEKLKDLQRVVGIMMGTDWLVKKARKH